MQVTQKIFSYLMQVIDATAGIFSVTLPPEALLHPGVLLAEVAIYDNFGNLRFTDPRYLKVVPNLERPNVRPVMPSDVRMALWDYCPADNTLLDDYEFTEEQIIYMIRRPLDLWNEMCPEGVFYAQPDNFRWREHWLRCTVGYLLTTAARMMRRNYLDYNAAGLSIKDNARWPYYLEEGRALIDEFKDWAQNKKIELNVGRGYATLGSQYGYSQYWSGR